jgi:DNA-binding beta-propeller fold protein YncE
LPCSTDFPHFLKGEEMNYRKASAIFLLACWTVAIACSPVAKILSAKTAIAPSPTPADMTRTTTTTLAFTPTSAPTALAQPTNPYLSAYRPLKATEIWGQTETETESLSNPRGLAVGPDGSLYVADAGNNRIQHYDRTGNRLAPWGLFSGTDDTKAPAGEFNEPWGIAAGPDGSVFVADTWNHRIQKFSAAGTFLKTWGASQSADPDYKLFGPRSVAVDGKGRVFVADTGNKRIVIYDSGGNYLGQIGEAGKGSGQFDEPVGVAIGPDGSLYVADAWNRRIQVFRELGGVWQYQTQWPIAGWEDPSTENKPYLAVSGDGRVWTTDPANGHILVFDAAGKYLFMFGTSGSDDYSFAFPSGIAADAQGRILIADAGNNRIMVFAGL